MEIPQAYKQLYKHWKDHTHSSSRSYENCFFKQDLVDQITELISERQHIWEQKVTGKLPPYTSDRILQQFRFCNIYRELDKQTMQIHTMLKPLEGDFTLWLLNLAYCRFICNPGTVEKTGLLSFGVDHNRAVTEKLKSLPSPKYGTAYIFPISTIMKSEYPTREEFFCMYLPKAIPKIAELIRTFNKTGVKDALDQLLPVFGFNMKFHFTEILIDVAYQFPQYIDLFKRFPIGPGARPTLLRLSKNDPEDTCLQLASYQPSDFPYLTIDGKKIYLSAENWEGICCEFRKYANLKNGKGRRRKFIS